MKLKHSRKKKLEEVNCLTAIAGTKKTIMMLLTLFMSLCHVTYMLKKHLNRLVTNKTSK